jgi:hypothetical protein
MCLVKVNMILELRTQDPGLRTHSVPQYSLFFEQHAIRETENLDPSVFVFLCFALLHSSSSQREL